MTVTWWQRLWHRHVWELVIDRAAGRLYLRCACGAQTSGWVEAD